MARYITITIPNDIRCSVNWGLRRVICFIGNDNRITNPSLADNVCYKKGVKIIDRRLHGTCKTAIKNLTFSKNNGKGSNNYIWKLHRYKAYKALYAIKNELEKLQTPDEIAELFQDIWRFLNDLFNGNVTNSAPEILGRAYIRDLYNKLFDPCYATDRKHIERIIESFKAYNTIEF